MKERSKALIEAASVMYGRRFDPMLISSGSGQGQGRVRLDCFALLRSARNDVLAMTQSGDEDATTRCVPLVRVGDVTTGRASSYYTGPIPAPPMKYVVKKGDIIVSMSGHFNVNRWNDQEALLDLRVMRIRGKHDSSTTDYLFHYLQPVFKRIEETTIGHRTKNLTAKAVNQIEVLLPPYKEQERIAEILNGYTDNITQLKAQIEQRRQQLITFRDELFDIENEPGVTTTTIGEICRHIYGGGTPATSHPEYYHGHIPWLRTQEVDWNLVDDTELKITEAAVEHSQAELIPSGCVIVALYGSTAGKAAINRIPLCTNQACCNLEVDTRQALNEYVFHWLQHEHPHLKALGEGARGNLNATKIKNYPIVIPPLDEQHRIVKAINTFYKETSRLEKELDDRKREYEQQRDFLIITAN